MFIYYFTRTGRSKQIAQAIASQQGTVALPITDGKNWSGLWGYLKAGAMALRGKGLPAVYQSPAGDERAVVVFPVWAGHLPPAVKTFALEVGRGRIIAIPTSLGGQLRDREGFVKIMDLVGKEISAPQSL
ncbi:flavodoxin [Zongyangia hominis]|uniref:Flavodoxin n=1 Tax=Zongyangia hominis TaxID=2763677 RepID=A0A926EBU0_9FIRM|nr:flavodoxin [Zongyangia hominis]MBC8570188.1 flavodoxin [Zongyangia hominis]